MPMIEPMLMELEQETERTRELFRRLPEDKLGWKPHEKSYSLGQLAHHIGSIGSIVSDFATQDTVQFPADRDQVQAQSRAEALENLEQGVAQVKDVFGTMSDERLLGPWRLEKEGAELFTVPRVALMRSFLLNHLYHHRGQLTVYLRELDVPLPSIYGPTADESPFG
jgi:uncharacterized damage-inducible protein DinB